LDRQLLLVRSQPQGEGSNVYDLIRGLISKGTTDGRFTVALPRNAVGSPVIASAPGVSVVAGFVEDPERPERSFVPAARVGSLLEALGVSAAPPEIGSAILGVTTATAGLTYGQQDHGGGDHGALVTAVAPGSAAATAAIRPGDVIQAFDGVDLIASPLLTALVRESPPGSRHHLTVIGPSGAERSVTVELGIRS
jgi:S1-C subfamily serine protease